MKVFATLWILLTALYIGTYRDEAFWQAPFKIGAMLALIFSIFFGIVWLTGILPPQIARIIPILFVVVVVGFVVYKLGRKVGTIGELFQHPAACINHDNVISLAIPAFQLSDGFDVICVV